MTWFELFLKTANVEKHRQFFVDEESTDLDAMREWTDRDLEVLGINKTRRIKIVNFLKLPDTITAVEEEEAAAAAAPLANNATFLAASQTIIQTVHVLPSSATETLDQVFASKLRRLDHFLLRVGAHDKKRQSRQKSAVLLFVNQRVTVEKVFEHLKKSSRYTTASKGGKSDVKNGGTSTFVLNTDWFYCVNCAMQLKNEKCC